MPRNPRRSPPKPKDEPKPLVCVLIGGGPFDGHSYVVEDAATSGSIFLIGSVAYIYRAIPDRPGVFVYDGWRKA